MESIAEQNGIDERYLSECTRINDEDIQAEFIRIPADLAYWNSQYAEAQRDALQAKLQLDVMKAKLLPLVRQGLIDAGGKVTESQVDAALDSQAGLIKARQQVVDTEARKALMYGYLDAVRTKKEMLISLGAHLRVLMEHDPVIRERVLNRQMRG